MIALTCATNTLAERAEDRLREFLRLALAEVHCDAQCGILVLRGCVPSPLLKTLAEQVAGRTAGVERVVNLIDVPS